MSNEPSYQQLIGRLESLEQNQQRSIALLRENRRLRRWLAGLAAVLLIVIVGGSYSPTDDVPKVELPEGEEPAEQPSRTAVVQRLAIVDEAGKERIVLGFDNFHKDAKEKVPGLYIFDANGHRRAMVGGDRETAGLWLAEAGRTRLSVTTSPGKFAGLGVFAEPGSPERGQIGLYYSDTGNPMLALNDRNGTTRVGLGLFDKGKPAMSLNNANGEPVFSQGEP
jgi:hypothetical protein